MSTATPFSKIQAEKQRLSDDAGATSATKDHFARSTHTEMVEALGVVNDVTTQDDSFIVHLDVDGLVLVCPLVRVHGRTMEETIAEVAEWRKGDAVKVTGKISWKLFDAEFRIDILTASKQ